MKNKVYLERSRKAFSLIELLVVISIIGILAGVVIVGVQSARKKGKDGRIQADMQGIKLKMEKSFAKKSTYSTFCQSVKYSNYILTGGDPIPLTPLSDPDKDVASLALDINNNGATGQSCYSDIIRYAYSVRLNSGKPICLDESNTVKEGQIAKGCPYYKESEGGIYARCGTDVPPDSDGDPPATGCL